ncbi:hypothetical protein B296_00025833, partial [Ensete ventricosum]
VFETLVGTASALGEWRHHHRRPLPLPPIESSTIPTSSNQASSGLSIRNLCVCSLGDWNSGEMTAKKLRLWTALTIPEVDEGRAARWNPSAEIVIGHG